MTDDEINDARVTKPFPGPGPDDGNDEHTHDTDVALAAYSAYLEVRSLYALRDAMSARLDEPTTEQRAAFVTIDFLISASIARYLECNAFAAAHLSEFGDIALGILSESAERFDKVIKMRQTDMDRLYEKFERAADDSPDDYGPVDWLIDCLERGSL